MYNRSEDIPVLYIMLLQFRIQFVYDLQQFYPHQKNKKQNTIFITE